MRLVALALTAGLAAAAPVPPPKSEFHQPGWDKPLDPDGDCKFTKGATTLTIELPAKDHDLDPRRKRLNAPRLLRDFEGDFRLEVRVRGRFRATEKAVATNAMSYSAGGLVVHLDEKGEASVRVEFGAVRHSLTAGTERQHVFMKKASGAGGGGVSGTVRFGPTRGWPLKADEAYLRLDRAGDRFMAYYSPDGKSWTTLAPITSAQAPAKVKVGVTALNTSDGPLKVTFDQFKLTKGKAGANARKK